MCKREREMGHTWGPYLCTWHLASCPDAGATVQSLRSIHDAGHGDVPCVVCSWDHYKLRVIGEGEKTQ